MNGTEWHLSPNIKSRSMKEESAIKLQAEFMLLHCVFILGMTQTIADRHRPFEAEVLVRSLATVWDLW